MASLAPALASTSAMERPISRRAPVTRAVRPFSRKRSKASMISALQPLGAVRDVVEGERHGDAAVVAHQRDGIGYTDMIQRLERALVEAARHPAAVGQRDCHLVDDLFALVVEMRRQAAQDRFDLVGAEADLLADPLVRRGRIARAPVAGDDAHRDLTLA